MTLNRLSDIIDTSFDTKENEQMADMETLLTHATLKEIRYVDYNKLLDEKFEQLNQLQTLMKDERGDKGVSGVIKMYEEQLQDLRKETQKWIHSVGFKIHRNHRIVIMIEELKDEE